MLIDETVKKSRTEVFGIYGTFFQEVVKEIGEEKTLEVHDRATDKMGKGLVEFFKSEVGFEFDMKKFADLMLQNTHAIGTESSYVFDGPNKVVFTNRNCPRCAGFLSAGVDPNTIHQHCARANAVISKYLGGLYPGLSFRVADWKGRILHRRILNENQTSQSIILYSLHRA